MFKNNLQYAEAWVDILEKKHEYFSNKTPFNLKRKIKLSHKYMANPDNLSHDYYQLMCNVWFVWFIAFISLIYATFI